MTRWLVRLGAVFALGWAAGACADEDPAPPKVAHPDFSADIEARKSYRIPAAEIFAFDFLLNRFNRQYYGTEYSVSGESIRKNLRSSWVTDADPYKTNQLGHPYQGSMYHGFSRSAGLNYWESFVYTFAGSVGWEIAGESTPPSRNDQIASGIGGSFLGEALFRMSSLVLEKGDGAPRFMREVSAGIISPSLGFNRLAFGERFRTVFPSRDPAYYSRMALAVSGTTQNEQGAAENVKGEELLADYSMDYGLPGKPDYAYKRPFDYFSFQATATSAQGFENVMTRGLLWGGEYEAGRRYRGIWGLYGSYDYISPQAFRISSTALSLGTTGQLWLARDLALQGTVMAGGGYAAVSTVQGLSSDRDYHYGLAPQALVATRLIFGDRASIDVTGRKYFVSGVAGPRDGRDDLSRADATFTLRINKQHAVAVKYLWNRRTAFFPDLGERAQTRATIGIYYVLLGDDRFGAVKY